MKSVYSLVLSDDVVLAADAAAEENGMSRSALIDAVLAEHFGVRVRRARIEDVFRAAEALERQFGAGLLKRLSGQNMDYASVINYRYNPSVNYSVGLLSGDALCEVKICLRTQNPALSAHFTRFCLLFDRLEREAGHVLYSETEQGKYTVQLPYAGEETAEEAAASICNFIRLADEMLAVYFNETAFGGDGCAAVLGAYQGR